MLEDNQKELEPGQPVDIEETPTEVPTGNWLDILYGILFQPVLTLRSVSQTRPIGLAFLVFFGVQLFSWAVTASLGAQTAWPGRTVPNLPTPMPVNFPEMMQRMLVVGELAGIIVSFFFWFSAAAIFNLLAEFLGGQSNGRGLFVALGLASLPEILIPPLRLLTHLGFPSWLSMFLQVGVFLWMIGLYVLAVREATRISTGRAVAAVIVAPLVFMIGLVVLMLILMMAAVIPFIPKGV